MRGLALNDFRGRPSSPARLSEGEGSPRRTSRTQVISATAMTGAKLKAVDRVAVQAASARKFRRKPLKRLNPPPPTAALPKRRRRLSTMVRRS